MSQKDKVKELVGRGLDSYHAKSVQQIDRIERKNKEQNHKINILTNELDNDYITKTEEGSVISLDHSEEGLVEICGLEGNTLVNYCVDGSKEMVLNGDVETEGTFVTTNEGVDNGMVDVLCEGNTMVNLLHPSMSSFDRNNVSGGGSGWFNSENLNLIKPNTIYTIISNITMNTGSKVVINNNEATASCFADSIHYDSNEIGVKITKVTSRSDLSMSTCVLRCYTHMIGRVVGTIILLEGDWTNKEIPPYFEGMKSVGEETIKTQPINGNLQEGYTDSYIYNKDTNGNTHWLCFKNGATLPKIAFRTDRNLLVAQSSVEYKYSKNEGTTWSTYTDTLSIPCSNVIQATIDLYNDTNYTTIGRNKDIISDSHKIEILSRNKNLFNKNEILLNKQINLTSGEIENSSQYHTSGLINIKPNTPYIRTLGNAIYYYDTNMNFLGYLNSGVKSPSNARYARFILSNSGYDYTTEQIEEGTTKTTYIEPKLNKKEILLNEPLRGLPNGIRDRFVKIGGKWFIERNCGEYTFNGVDGSYALRTDIITDFLIFNTPQIKHHTSSNSYKGLVCNLFNQEPNMVENTEFIRFATDVYTCISINPTKLSTPSVEGFKQWLQSNPTTVVYQLQTPTYEPLLIEPSVTLYNDVAHISNNSIIPCNMKVKNSGYNAIIKPSTLYTIALDTNKSGTIGMNLGGVKGTTSNNVLTLTTPSTMSDDSLRIYGKGIKGSKVRILEGDKTNFIPSHFEGMKSCFEDVGNNVEIKVNDTSLFDIHNRNYKLTNGGINLTIDGRKIEYDADKNYSTIGYDRFDFVKDKKYTIAIKGNNSRVLFTNNSTLSATGITSNNIRFVTFVATSNAYTNRIENGEKGACRVTIEDVWIYEGEYDENKHTTQKHNKIQFLLNEPLRGLRNGIKDRLVFKDGRLVVERNCGKAILSESLNWKRSTTTSPYYEASTVGIIEIPRDYTSEKHMVSNILPTMEIYSTNYNYGICLIGLSKTCRLRIKEINTIEEFMDYISKNKLEITYQLAEPTYEEIPYELQKILLEGYANGTLFIDTIIPPTVEVKYAGQVPIVKATKLNKTEVSYNSMDINDNIIPYMMDMDFRIIMLEVNGVSSNTSVSKLLGGAFEMLQRDILSKRYSKDEYRYRIDTYLSLDKITKEEYNKLGDLLNE